MKTILGAGVSTAFLISVVAPAGLAVVWLLLNWVHAPDFVLYSAEALMIIPIVMLASLVFKNALSVERDIRDQTEF